MSDEDIRANRRSWDARSDEYQERNRSQIERQMTTGDITWGVWGIPESELQILGDTAGKRVLELGCGAAQWSIALARGGARPVGLDLSERQLHHARRAMAESHVFVPVVQAAAEQIPFAPETFDIVFADYGAFTFGDPHHTIPGSARVLRAGGLLAFSILHPLLTLTWPLDEEHPTDRLGESYFDLYKLVDETGTREYQLSFGGWVALFKQSGLIVENLIETRPQEDTTSTYRTAEDKEWARRWPMELIWRLRKR